MNTWLENLKNQFYLNFIEGSRWKNITNGLRNTLLITLFAALLGIVLGIIVAAIRTTYDKNKEVMKRRGGIGYIIITVLNGISKLYLTIFRGTPMVVQLLIMAFIIFKSSDGMFVAVIAFGINSGAYVAEIFRGGIMSIDNGQFEAGRSLGFNYMQTMRLIIIPQAFKNVLPTLLNEFITLLKETSVAGYIGITDLTRGGYIIRGVTFSPYMPLFAIALIYLILVVVLTKIVSIIERRLKKSER